MHDARSALRADVAHRYHVERLTQKEIAFALGCSVPTISRLLAEATAQDMVEVRIRSDIPVDPELQRALVHRFGLRIARVALVPADRQCDPLDAVAELAARYVTTILTDGAVVSVAWGSSVHEAVRRIKSSPRRDVHVVQGLGSLGSLLPSIDNPGITESLAARVDGTPHFLPAPMIVDSAATRDALARVPDFGHTLDLAGRSDIALIGIGLADPGLSGMCRAGYLDPRELNEIGGQGAIGDIIVEFFDLFGNVQETSVRDRVVGMRLSDLGRARTVIAIARGTIKAPAILGALRTELIDVLITDSLTTRRVLELAEAYPTPRVAPMPLSAVAARPGPPQRRPSQESPRPDIAPVPFHEDLVHALMVIADPRHRPAPAAAGMTVPHDDRDAAAGIVTAILHQGKTRGELKCDADCGTIARALLGAIWYRAVIEQVPVNVSFVRGLVVTVIDGSAPPKPLDAARLSPLRFPAKSGLRAVESDVST